MKKNRIINFIISLSVLFSPLAVNAAIVPCGTSEHPEVCTLCHFIVGIKNIIDWGMGVLTFVAIGAIVLAGIFYIISAGNQDMMTKAKNILIQTLTGFAVVLGAWLIVTYSMYIIGASNENGVMRTNGAWYEFTCDTISNQAAIDIGSIPTSATTSTTSSTVASAAVDSSGNCLNAAMPGAQTCTGYSCISTCGSISSYVSAISSASSRYGVSENLIRGVICRESSGNTNAIRNESDGTMSCGLMQVNVRTQAECDYQVSHPAENIMRGTGILSEKVAQAQRTMNSRGYDTVEVEEMAAAAYNCCANGEDPNLPSSDCTAANDWGLVPKWACPIDPGTSEFNMCAVKDYACSVGSCE